MKERPPSSHGKGTGAGSSERGRPASGCVQAACVSRDGSSRAAGGANSDTRGYAFTRRVTDAVRSRDCVAPLSEPVSLCEVVLVSVSLGVSDTVSVEGSDAVADGDSADGERDADGVTGNDSHRQSQH